MLSQELQRFIIGGFVTLVSICAPSVGFAHSPGPVPIRDEFSPLELTLIGANFVLGNAILLVGPRVIERQPTQIRAPQPGAFDYAVSDALHGNLETGARVGGGITDPALLAAPGIALLFYGASSFRTLLAEPWFGQHHIGHSTLAYAEALGWTAMTVGIARLIVQRDRPWVALDRPQFARDTIEPTTSLASSHTALGATFASFVALDLSAHLASHEGWNRWLATLVPFSVLYGFVGLAAAAHVADQENFLSDELAGLAIGTASGAIAWIRHFDADGKPRARRSAATVTVVPGRKPTLSLRLRF